MDVSPKLLREVEFREQWRGYNPDEVDDFLERLAAALEILQDRLHEANERAAAAERRASESSGTDETLKRTLVLAQRTADAALQEAREEAAGIVARAREEASTVLGEAQRQAKELVVTATERASEAEELARTNLRDEVEALRRAREALGADVDVLEEYLATQRTRLIGEVEGQLRWLQAPGHLAIDERPTMREVDIPAPADVPVVEVPSVESPVVPIDMADADGEPTGAAWTEPLPDDVQWADDVDDVGDVDHRREGDHLDAPLGVDTVDHVPGVAAVHDALADGLDGPRGMEADPGAGEPTGVHPGLLDDDDEEEAGGAASPGLFDDDDGAVESLVEHDDDPFMTELRRAVDDPEPLGPRDDVFGADGVGDGAADASIYDQDLTPSARFRLRRRR